MPRATPTEDLELIESIVTAHPSGIRIADLEAELAQRGGGGLNLIPWPKVDFAKFGEIESKPLSRIQKISGANLARNWAMIPHVTQFEDADITEMEAFRKRLGEENKDENVTPLDYQIKAEEAAQKK